MKRNATGESIFTLHQIVEAVCFSKDRIPDHLRAKPLRFGDDGDDGIYTITDIQMNVPMPKFLAQINFCASIGVSSDAVLAIFAKMAKGNLPDDVIVLDDSNRVLWFVVDVDETVVPVDITGWDAYPPNVQVRDFPCCKYKTFSSTQAKTRLLQRLGDSIDTASSHFSSSELLNITEVMKQLYDSL